MGHRWGRAAVAAAMALAGAVGTAGPAAAEGARILLYHRFGEDAVPATNIRLEQFETHLRLLEEGGHAVLPLDEVVRGLRGEGTLPDKAVAITVDDAFRSVLTEAWPRLRARGWPLTLFVSTDAVDAGVSGYLSWHEIRRLAGEGVTIGAHSAAHAHMPDAAPAENRRDLARMAERFRDELGAVPRLFAYPYGEASLAVAEVAAEAGFPVAFGQHSGVAHAGSPMDYLPRFAFNEAYGDAERFLTVLGAQPLPVGDITPADMTLNGPNPPAFGFTLAEGVSGAQAIACYASHAGPVTLDRLGGRRIEVRFAGPLPPGRSRINCTAPAPEGGWRWFGRQFYVPQDAGR